LGPEEFSVDFIESDQWSWNLPNLKPLDYQMIVNDEMLKVLTKSWTNLIHYS